MRKESWYYIKTFSMESEKTCTVQSRGLTEEGSNDHATQTIKISVENPKETKAKDKEEKEERKETKKKQTKKDSKEPTDGTPKATKCHTERDLFLEENKVNEIQRLNFKNSLIYAASGTNDVLKKIRSNGLSEIYCNVDEHVIYEDHEALDVECTWFCYDKEKVHLETYMIDRDGSEYTVSHISQPHIIRALYCLREDDIDKIEKIINPQHKNVLRIQGAFIINGFLFVFTEPCVTIGLSKIIEKYLLNPYLKLNFIIELTEAFEHCSKIHQYGDFSQNYMTCTENKNPCTLKLSHFGHGENSEDKPKMDIYILGRVVDDIISSDVKVKEKDREELNKFITLCSEENPKKRPTFGECKKFFSKLRDFYLKDTTK